MNSVRPDVNSLRSASSIGLFRSAADYNDEQVGLETSKQATNAAANDIGKESQRRAKFTRPHVSSQRRINEHLNKHAPAARVRNDLLAGFQKKSHCRSRDKAIRFDVRTFWVVGDPNLCRY